MSFKNDKEIENLYIGDPLVDSIRSKQQQNDHDLVLLEAALFNLDEEHKAIDYKRQLVIQGLNKLKQERKELDERMVTSKNTVLNRWTDLSNRVGMLDDGEGGDMTLSQLPSIVSILPTELILNILEYLSFRDISFSVSVVCKEWHRLSLSDSIWKNLFHIRWNTHDIHLDTKPLKPTSSFWASPILPSSPMSLILPSNNNHQRYYDRRSVSRKTPQSAIFPPETNLNAPNNNQNNNNQSTSSTNSSGSSSNPSSSSDTEPILNNIVESCEVFNSHLPSNENEETMYQDEQQLEEQEQQLEQQQEMMDQHQDDYESDNITDESADDEDHHQQMRKRQRQMNKRMRIDWRELYFRRQKIEHNWWNNICNHKKFAGHSDWITCMQFDGKMLVTGSWDATLKLWNIETGECLVLSSPDMPCGHTAGITCIQFKGTKLISGSSDSTLRIWDLTTGECLYVLRGHTDGVSCLTLIDDSTLVSGSLDNTINLWSIDTGRLLHSFTNHTSAITCLYYKNNLLISGTMGGTLNVIDIPSRIVLQTLHGHSDRVTSLQWWDGPEGEMVISSSWDQTLRVWNIQTGKSVYVLTGHTFRVRCTHLRGHILVSGSWDSTVRVWDLLTGKCMHTLQGHSFNVWGVQMEGRRLVTASWDRKVNIWDLESGKLMYTLDGHSESIICLQFKGSKLVTAAKEIIVYDFDI